MRALIITLTIISIGCISCTKEEEAYSGERGGALVIGTMELPASISPLEPSVFSSNEIVEILFLRLHSIDPQTGRMKPILAESWEFSEDLKSVTYYLRKDVKWWDGQPVTAHDVLYTYERMKDPSVNYPNINSLRFIKEVKVLGEYAIKFTFDKVYADILLDSDIMPVPKHLHERMAAAFGAAPVGNGPYRIDEWVQGSAIVLKANEAYHLGRPPLDEIMVRYYTNADKMADDFQRGDLDLIFDIGPNVARELAGDGNVNILSRPGNSYLYVAWNLGHPFLNDRDVRRALAMAIDRRRILNDVYAGMGELSLGPMPPSSWGYDSTIEPVPYDVETARSILQSKGFGDYNRNRIVDRDRTDFTIRIITNSENPDRLAILRYIAEDLQKIGVRVTTQALNAGAFVAALLNGEFDGFIMGWRVADKIDPAVFWHSKGRYNLVSYANPVVDSLIDAGLAMLDRKKAKVIWNEFQKAVYEDQPYAFLVVPDNVAAAYKRVRGLESGARLAQAHYCWIPEVERRVSVAAVPPAEVPSGVTVEAPVEEPVATTVEPPAVTTPEMILEAAARSDTAVSDTGTAAVLSMPPPPKPSVITRAEPLTRVQPKYPAAALEFRAAGTIVVRVLVGADGKVKEASILKSFGNPACEQAALNAARQWEFTPATKDGVPYEQRVSIPFTFAPE